MTQQGDHMTHIEGFYQQCYDNSSDDKEVSHNGGSAGSIEEIAVEEPQRHLCMAPCEEEYKENQSIGL